MIGKEQFGCKSWRSCIDNMFVLKQVTEKRCEKGREVYRAFAYLEQTYDHSERVGLWKVLQMYGMGGKQAQI